MTHEQIHDTDHEIDASTFRHFGTQAERSAFRAGRSAAVERSMIYVTAFSALVAGIGAMLFAIFASAKAGFVAGAALLFSGSVGVFASFWRRQMWQLAVVRETAIVAVIGGVLMVLDAFTGLLDLNSLTIMFLMIVGFLKLYYGMREQERGSFLILCSGLADLAITFALLFLFPVNSLWILDFLVGFAVAACALVLGYIGRTIGQAGVYSK